MFLAQKYKNLDDHNTYLPECDEIEAPFPHLQTTRGQKEKKLLHPFIQKPVLY